MSITPTPNLNHNDATPSEAVRSGGEKKVRVMGLLLGILFAVALSEGVYAWWLTTEMQKTEKLLAARITTQQESIERLHTQLGGADMRFSAIEDDMASTKGALGTTQGDLRRTRNMATQLEKKQKESTEVLSSELGKLQQDQVATRGTVGNITNEVTGVKHDVTLTKEELATTKSQLQRVVGDLGVQSDLIARNHGELNELRARGERDYFEFDLRKSNKPQRVGTLALQLRKSDVKRQKYTINLVADDRNIEKKDKTVFEPVQFYQAGSRQATEIVVNQIYKDRIVGYISAPKVREPRVSSLGISSEPASQKAGG